MKKSILIFTFLLAVLLITSCGHSFDSDVKRIAELTCESQKFTFDQLIEAGAFAAEHTQEIADITARHTKDAVEFAEAVAIEIAKCK